MKNRIEEIKERLEKATPGPWWWEDKGDFYVLLTHKPNAGGFKEVMVMDDGSACGDFWEIISGNTPDGQFVANAPTDIQWLIEEVERLERMLNFVKEDRVLRGKKMYDFMMGENNKKEVKKT